MRSVFTAQNAAFSYAEKKNIWFMLSQKVTFWVIILIEIVRNLYLKSKADSKMCICTRRFAAVFVNLIKLLDRPALNYRT